MEISLRSYRAYAVYERGPTRTVARMRKTNRLAISTNY